MQMRALTCCVAFPFVVAPIDGCSGQVSSLIGDTGSVDAGYAPPDSGTDSGIRGDAGGGSDAGGRADVGSESDAGASDGNIQVDFTVTVAPVDPFAIGIDESEYGSGGRTIANDSTEQQRFAALAPAIMRVPLGFATPGNASSAVVCEASGCVGAGGSPDGDAYVESILAAGVQPEIQVSMGAYLPYSQANVALFATDAAALVKRFNVNAATLHPSPRWIIGNEPDNGGPTATDYCAYFNAAYDAMKAVDSTILIGGPVTAYFDTNYLQTFLSLSGSRTDFLDFHSYGEGGNVSKTEAQLLAETPSYESNLSQLQSMISTAVPSRATSITTQVGEWNVSWSSSTEMYLPFAIVWDASVMGHILHAGALSLPYGTKNGSLGALFEQADSTYGTSQDDPMPLYHAVGMYSGEGLFPRFGTSVVSATTSLATVEVFASNNPKNIVVINKDPTASVTAAFTLVGKGTGQVVVYAKNGSANPFAPPAQLAPSSISNGAFTYGVAPYSVTVFLLGP
jgi:hypothetical protein